MLWTDFDFDYNDQLAKQYMKYKGDYYDVGTKVKMKGRNGPIVATFIGWRYQGKGCFEGEDCGFFDMYDSYDYNGVNKYVLEIIDPVYPELHYEPVEKNQREKPPKWDVDMALPWYIAIMVIATIFHGRLLIWIAATVIFFLWKNGFLNRRGKK